MRFVRISGKSKSFFVIVSLLLFAGCNSGIRERLDNVKATEDSVKEKVDRAEEREKINQVKRRVGEQVEQVDELEQDTQKVKVYLEVQERLPWTRGERMEVEQREPEGDRL